MSERSENRPIGFGVIGGGVIGPTHCDAINQTPTAQLLAVCDKDPAKAADLSQRYDVPGYTSLTDFFKHPGLQAVSLCVPSGLHARLGVQAAQAGLHVLTEKPLDVTVEAGQELINECDKAGVKLGVISQHRFAPDVQQLKARVEAGELGQLVLGEALTKWYRTQAYYDSAEWRGTAALDGGALMNQGIHYIDLLQWLMGRAVKVKAATMTRSHTIEAEDVGVAIVEFENGALGNIIASTACYPGVPERIELHGTDGTAIIQEDKLITYLVRSEVEAQAADGIAVSRTSSEVTGGASDPAAIQPFTHAVQVADFVEAILQNREPAISGRDALRPLQIITAIYEAAQHNREIVLPLD